MVEMAMRMRNDFLNLFSPTTALPAHLIRFSGRPLMALRAYLAPCGLGLGHVRRCEILLKRMREHKPVEGFFATYGEGFSYIKKAGLRALRVRDFKIAMKPNGEVDVERTLRELGYGLKFVGLVGKQLAQDVRYMSAIGPDIVISDTRAVAVMAAKLLSLPCVCIVHQIRIYIPRKRRMLRVSRLAEAGLVATLGPIWLMADAVFVPDFPEPYTISLMNLRLPSFFDGRFKLVGPMLEKRPEELPSQEELKERLGVEPEEPLIFMPITGMKWERPFFVKKMVPILSELAEKEGLKVIVSFGRPDRGEEVAFEKGGLRALYWVKDFYACLKACDVLITRGGHGAILEAMSYGKPMLIVPPPSHTEKMLNSLRAKEVGVAKVLLQHELAVKTVGKALRALLEETSYKRAVGESMRIASELDAAGVVAREAVKLASG